MGFIDIMRKIYLEGQLGQKFGTSHVFCGDTPAEAFRLISANYPEFRKYLIDCHEKDIAFHVEVNNEEIDVTECLLPLSKGDIVITPVPAGSKSGGAKILTAIAIAAFIFFNPALFSTGGAMGGWGGTAAFGLNTQGLILAAVSVNLALVGLQQLMAPDPATDQQNEEGYLFTGDARNIVEGDPVPVLYGELRVPGIPVSVEVLPNKRNDNAYGLHYSNSFNDTLYNNYSPGWWAENDATGGQSAAQSGALSVNNKDVYGRSQNILYTSVISEGPIQGLVNGASSVYLNNDPAIDPSDSNTTLKGTETKATVTNGSTSGSINKPTSVTTTSSEDSASASIKFYEYASTTGTVSINYIAVSGLGYLPTHLTVTTSSSFFTSDMAYDVSNPQKSYKARIISSSGETLHEGYVTTYTSATSAQISFTELNRKIVNGSSYTIAIDAVFDGSVADDGTITLDSNFGGTSGDYEIEVTGTKETPDEGDNIFAAAKYKNFGVQFRTGHLYQEPLKGLNGEGIGNTSITTSLNNAIVGPGNSGTNTYTYNTSTLGLTAAQAAEADEVRFLISYGQLINFDEMGGERPGKAWYDVDVRFSLDGSSFGNWISVQDAKRHYGTYNSTYTIEEYINLEQLRPNGAVDWEVRITRLTDNDKAYEEYRTGINTKYTSSTQATITSATTSLKEILNYPLTAVAKAQFNSQDFSSLPKVGFHCRGLKVKVPSNYITREEASDGVASYKRNVSTGVIESSYQDWDGNFRSELIYTNNPAWIFYDILINNRYGLGSYLTENDIDKYTLYRIARYCDELVDDGNGGEEPRFTTNVYLTKSTDAYKILKDLATTFRGMLYWLDGEIVGVIDQASDAVYNFSSSNVINGEFTYESTGSKTRANQVAVTWNNPLSDYKPEALLIEDGENIAKTGKIIRESAVAFGATSEGQALRYGRWKLWTAKNQTEIVAFSTAINAAFLRPGDIVNVQDPYRHPPYQTLSGRISSSGTLTASTIPLDREITLQADSTYELNVLIEEAGAFLSQDSAVINSTSYALGELILADSLGNDITTSLAASNLVDDSGNPVEVVWKPYTRVETQTVSTAAGSGITSLTVSTAFSTAPNSQTVWALKRVLTASEAEVLGTKQEYKILGITQNDDSTYNISAVKHYNEKFDAIDNEWTLSVQDPVFPPELADTIVPPPANVYLIARNLDNDSIKDDVTLSWDVPLNSDGSVYDKVDKYEINHSLPDVKQNPIFLDGTINTVGPYQFPSGTHTVSVTTISVSGKRSKPKKAFITISEEVQEKQVPRLKGVARGGVSNAPISLNASNEFEFAKTDYTFTPIGAPDIEVLGVPATATTYNQDVSNIAAIADATWASYTLTEKLYAAHYILMDSSDASDPIKLIKWNEDSTLNIGYWFNSGTGNTAASSHWSAATGTITIPAQTIKVTGNSTTFTSDFEVGDLIKIGTSNVAKITYISSDTIMFLDRSFSSTISSETAYAPTLRINKNTDAIIAGVRNLQTGGFKLIPSPNFTVVADPEVYEGDDGIIQTEGYVYYDTAEASAPSGPGSSATYTWATGTITGMNSGWQQSPPQMDAGANGKFWYARYFVNQSTSSDTTSTPSFGTVTAGHNFTGLVTFQSGDLTDGTSTFDPDSKITTGGAATDINTNITTINGGKITTGSVTAATLTNSTSNASYNGGANLFGLGNHTATVDIGGTSYCATGYFYSNTTNCTALIAEANANSNAGIAATSKGNNANGFGGFFGWSATSDYSDSGKNKVYVGGKNYHLLAQDGTTTAFSVSESGDVVAAGNVTAYSDLRLKDDVELIKGAVTKCMALRGVTFTMKGNSERSTGLIAQEVRKVLPEAVTETEDGVLTLAYGNMAGLFVEAIKELQGQISELKREVKRLKDDSSN